MVRHFTIASFAGLAAASLCISSPVSAQVPMAADRPAAPRTSVAVTTVGPHKIYNGTVTLTHGGGTFGGHYREEPEAHVGVRARIAWTSDMMGDVSGALFVAQGSSLAVYTGIGGSERLSRRLLTLGLDLGWEPAASEGSWGSLRFPFGPSIIWRSLDTSSGNRDEFANPDDFTVPEVDWSDRHWLALGGYGGMACSFALVRHLGVRIEGLARFFYSDASAWSGQEEDDIRDSTGNAVTISYQTPVVFLWSAQLGLEWTF